MNQTLRIRELVNLLKLFDKVYNHIPPQRVHKNYTKTVGKVISSSTCKKVKT